jgi:hypothetical protein
MAGPVAVDYTQAQDLASQQKQGFSDLLGQQQATSQGLFNQYTAASNAQPKLVDVLTKAQQDAGIGGLQDNINLFNSQASGVKGLIDRLNENTSTRTAGTGANQAYLDRLRASEGGALNTQLSRLTTGLGDATNAFNTSNANTGQLLSATQADQQTALHPLELQINSLSDQFARQITGFTTSAQTQLDTLMAKLNNQQDLNNKEWQQAATLAAQEQQFQQQRQLAAQSSASTGTFLNAGLTSAPQNPQQQQAANALTSLFKTNQVGTISNTIKAITDSANRGNTYDQLKLQLLKQYQSSSPYANIITQALSYKAPSVSVNSKPSNATISF